MDKTMLSDGMPVAESELVVVAKRKPGRPRGSTSKARALNAFQSQLMDALGIQPTEVATLEQTAPRFPFYVEQTGCVIAVPSNAGGPLRETAQGLLRVLWLTWTDALATVW